MSDERKIIRLFTINKDETQTHYHQHIELIYLLGGNVDIQIDDQIYSMSADDFLIINANKTHSFFNAKGLIAARFEIDYNMVAELLGTTQLFFWCNTVIDRNEAYDKCRDLMDKLLIESFEREHVNELQLHAYYYQLLSILTSNFLISQNEWASNSAESKDRDRMQMIQSYIQSNYQSQVSLNDLARKLYLSNAYLSKYIKRKFGVTFVEYLNRVRMFHAVDELMYTDKNLTHIALDNGFPTSASFNRAFKETYGVTPSEYRKRAHQEMKISTADSQENGRANEEIRSILREKEHLNPLTEGIYQYHVNAHSYKRTEPVTERGINIKYASSLLSNEVQQQLLCIKKECGLDYLRIRPNIDKNKGQTNDLLLDQHSVNIIMDFLVENKIRPIIVIEISKDQIISAREIIKQDGLAWLKKIWEPSELLIKTQLIRMVNRYGIDVVETWDFEFAVWPEAECEELLDSYCYCFTQFYSRVKALSENISIGIGTFILGFDYSRITTLLSALNSSGVVPDFIAFSSFQKISLAVLDRDGIRNSTDGNFIYNQMQMTRKYLDDSGIKVKDIHINEWNHTISDENAFNDSCNQAAYILKNLISMKGHISRMVYWHAIDASRGNPENGGFLTGDSGIISRYGIRKPAYFAMRFFNKLLPYEIQRNEHGIVTTNGRNCFVLVSFNYKNMTYANARILEEELRPENIASYLSNNEHIRLKYCIDNVRNGNYTVRIYYINPAVGSVQDTWKSLGYSKNLSKYERKYLRESAHPAMEIKRIEVKSGIIEIETELAPQEIKLMDIQLQYD